VVVERAVRHRASDPLEPTGLYGWHRPRGHEYGRDLVTVCSRRRTLSVPRRNTVSREPGRSLATKQLGSKRRRRQVEEVARLHRKVKNQRSNFAHQLSRQLVNEYDFIAYEDLKIAKMVSTPTARPDPEAIGGVFAQWRKAGKPTQSINPRRGVGQFLSFLIYKAESAGRTVVKVNLALPARRVPSATTSTLVTESDKRSFDVWRAATALTLTTMPLANILRAGRAL